MFMGSMRFDLGEDVEALREMVHRWAQERLKPIAAAVEGHAIAGGLVLALAADFVALQTGGYKLGLTELQVGVPFPDSALQVVIDAIPARAADSTSSTMSPT